MEIPDLDYSGRFLTIEAVINPQKKAATIFSHGDAWRGVGLMLSGANLDAVCSLRPTGNGEWMTFSGGPLTTRTRYHLAIVIDGRLCRVYLDGRLVGSRELPANGNSTIQIAKLPSYIGRHKWQSTGDYFKGLIDEVRVSNKARYDKDFTPEKRFEPDEHTLALYHFDEGQGDVLVDSSGNGHHGKIHGAKWVKADGSPIPASANLRPLPAIAPFDAGTAKRHQQAWADYLGVPVELENSIGMKFRLIPPGEFMMGSTPEEIDAALKVAGDDKWLKVHAPSEAPRHKVTLTQPFYLGTHEVTQAQYQKVMGKNPSHFAATGEGKTAVRSGYRRLPRRNRQLVRSGHILRQAF